MADSAWIPGRGQKLLLTPPLHHHHHRHHRHHRHHHHHLQHQHHDFQHSHHYHPHNHHPLRHYHHNDCGGDGDEDNNFVRVDLEEKTVILIVLCAYNFM